MPLSLILTVLFVVGKDAAINHRVSIERNRPPILSQMTRKTLVRKQGTFASLLAELRSELSFLAGHLFRAERQNNQFQAMKNRLPFRSATVGMVLDFAENFACSIQDEVQSAHWYHNQVTVHPVVCYYGWRCRRSLPIIIH